MTRILEALRKSQARKAPIPFPHSQEPVSHRAAVPRPAGPVGPGEPAFVPRIDLVPVPPAPEDVVRQMTALRVALEAALEDRRTRVVMFTSSMGGEGVTTVASHFASVLAADGRLHTLLVDANPRHAAPVPPGGAARVRPMVAPGAGEAGAPALAMTILGDEVRAAGGRAPAALRAFLSTACTQFDWVVVDGPPVLEAAESIDLAPTADGVVFVVRSGHTRRPVALRAAELLRKSGIRILGAVLNRRRFEIPDFIYRRV